MRATMKPRWVLLALLAVIASSAVANSAAGRQFLGAWSGSWEGGGTGAFYMNFEARDDGTLDGSVAIGADSGEYSARFATLSFSGSQMTGRYQYPYGDGEIVIEGSFAVMTAAGTWKLVRNDGSDVMQSGTWRLTKD